MSDLSNHSANNQAENNSGRITPVGDATPPQVQPKRPAPKTMVITAPTGQNDPVFAWLIRLEGDEAGRAHQLGTEETIIGRDEETVNIFLEDPTVSSLHAKVLRTMDEDDQVHYTIYDMGSANGTYVEENEVFEHRLVDGARLRFGKTKLVFKCL